VKEAKSGKYYDERRKEKESSGNNKHVDEG
jgi:hypothetical protein